MLVPSVPGTFQSSEVTTRSTADEYYDADRFDSDTDLKTKIQCPVKGCVVQPLSQLTRGRWTFPYCEVHGLELHPNSNTFVYYNGEDLESKKRARLRNFKWQQPFVKRHVLDNPTKAETHRLGYENSEDTLSWNVFVPLLETQQLEATMRWLLQGHDTLIKEEPKLYLWGSEVDLSADRFESFEPLGKARKFFEPNIKRFLTEPDIMLITNSMVMCIEAKFTSGNPKAQARERVVSGEKPKSKLGLIDRYAKRWPESERHIRHAMLETGTLHSQLFRNVIFASWMAQELGRDWHVVNLVSTTQWKLRATLRDMGYDFGNPTDAVRRYLRPAYQRHFTWCTWEGFYKDLIQGKPELESLSAYLEGKTAHLKRAFYLSHD